MSWQDYALARQHLVEHRIGTRIRQNKAVEDAKVRKSKAVLARQERGR